MPGDSEMMAQRDDPVRDHPSELNDSELPQSVGFHTLHLC